jgi:hypothetical protein
MRFLAFSIFALGVLSISGPTAQAQQMCPGGMMPTIASLEDCVTHCLNMGHIDNAGIANSLLAKLNAAQAAEDRGQTSVAISILEAFINEVTAEAGKHIDTMHADHMVMHAEAVIAALGP